ncbi:hypothetical protein IZ6_25060 [Terrihabitans soli]|uniref:Calcineurin-like phosphoesterase domain-containing protein n=1 Tax=Terrihabitans soli TaxID=708113 RepID=A0A6S6QXL4_9HYPH|nr:hypothetical protein [Terrihabitans soli]BCJ91771.1 hypothetical protein IZ6_25060 [Terrihabitans soli]
MQISPQILFEAVKATGGYTQASRFLKDQGHDISRDTIRRHLEKLKLNPLGGGHPEFEVELPSFDEVDVDALIERRKEEFAKSWRQHQAEKVIPISVKLDGPIGIGFLGDPHLDSPGCDVETVFRHAALFDGRNPGLFVGCMGDVWDNWVGRLQSLYAKRSMSDAEAIALVRNFVSRVNWLFFIYGNHDLWKGRQELLTEMIGAQSPIKKDWRVKVGLRLPNGRTVKIYAAHRFQGNSQWSTVFGVAKKAQLDGTNDIYVGADKHISGYTHGWHDGNDRMWHAIQVAAYKKIDDYADEIGAERQDPYQCPVALIDPSASNPINYIRWEFDPEEGAERLKWMRSRFESGKSAS